MAELRASEIKKSKIERKRKEKMTNIIHPKLDHEMVEDFEEDDEDDPIAALPFRSTMVCLLTKNP